MCVFGVLGFDGRLNLWCLSAPLLPTRAICCADVISRARCQLLLSHLLLLRVRRAQGSRLESIWGFEDSGIGWRLRVCDFPSIHSYHLALLLALLLSLLLSLLLCASKWLVRYCSAAIAAVVGSSWSTYCLYRICVCKSCSLPQGNPHEIYLVCNALDHSASRQISRRVARFYHRTFRLLSSKSGTFLEVGSAGNGLCFYGKHLVRHRAPSFVGSMRIILA